MMSRLQDEILAREDEKAKARRRRDEERAVRFMNSKSRTIGVDKDFLDQQIEEKKKVQLEEEQMSIDEGIYQEQLRQYLEESQLVEQQMKTKEIEDVKATLLEQMKIPKNNALGRGEPLDINECGISSAQRFTGEDEENGRRKIAQQEQTKQWCAQQIFEKKRREAQQAEDSRMYAEYVLAEDAVRCDVAREEASNRTALAKSVQMYNRERAEEAKLRKMIEDEARKQQAEAMIVQAQESAFLSEDASVAQNATSPHRVRPDHFKGFGPDKVQCVYRENDDVIAEKRQIQSREREHEKEWAEYQARVIRKMEEAEIEHRELVAKENRAQAAALEMQRQELKERQHRMEKERFGAIGEGFFQGFGKSCR